MTNEAKMEATAKRIKAAYNGSLADFIKSKKLNMLERADTMNLELCRTLEVTCNKLGFQMKANKAAKRVNDDYLWGWFYRLDSIEYVGKGKANNNLIDKYIKELKAEKARNSNDVIHSWEELNFKKIKLNHVSSPVGLIAFNTVQNRLGIIIDEPKKELYSMHVLLPNTNGGLRLNTASFQWSNTIDNKLSFYAGFINDDEIGLLDHEHSDDKITVLKELSDKLGADYYGK